MNFIILFFEPTAQTVFEDEIKVIFKQNCFNVLNGACKNPTSRLTSH